MSESYIRYLADSQNDRELREFETKIWQIRAHIETYEKMDEVNGVRGNQPSIVEHGRRYRFEQNLIPSYQTLEILSDDLHERYQILYKVAQLKIQQQNSSS